MYFQILLYISCYECLEISSFLHYDIMCYRYVRNRSLIWNNRKVVVSEFKFNVLHCIIEYIVYTRTCAISATLHCSLKGVQFADSGSILSGFTLSGTCTYLIFLTYHTIEVCLCTTCSSSTALCKQLSTPVQQWVVATPHAFVSNPIDLGYWKADKVTTNTSEPPPITLLRWTTVLQSTVLLTVL